MQRSLGGRASEEIILTGKEQRVEVSFPGLLPQGPASINTLTKAQYFIKDLHMSKPANFFKGEQLVLRVTAVSRATGNIPGPYNPVNVDTISTGTYDWTDADFLDRYAPFEEIEYQRDFIFDIAEDTYHTAEDLIQILQTIVDLGKSDVLGAIKTVSWETLAAQRGNALPQVYVQSLLNGNRSIIGFFMLQTLKEVEFSTKDGKLFQAMFKNAQNIKNAFVELQVNNAVFRLHNLTRFSISLIGRSSSSTHRQQVDLHAFLQQALGLNETAPGEISLCYLNVNILRNIGMDPTWFAIGGAHLNSQFIMTVGNKEMDLNYSKYVMIQTSLGTNIWHRGKKTGLLAVVPMTDSVTQNTENQRKRELGEDLAKKEIDFHDLRVFNVDFTDENGRNVIFTQPYFISICVVFQHMIQELI